MAKEFSEFSNEYSQKKVAFQDIKEHLDEIMSLFLKKADLTVIYSLPIL